SAAGRAAALTRRPRRRREQEAQHAAPVRRLLRPAVVIPLALVLVGLGLFIGSHLYLDRQYYVGTSDGEVVVYRGIPGSLAGLRLHSVVERTGLQYGALAEADRSSVNDGITADSKADAETIVQRLQKDAADAASTAPPPGTPGASPSVAPPTPSATPTP
ncbi:MAG TPA: hypothetical protein VHE83_05990, partial [Mycobacteriales bacterium]|nr:hypothetical protein [Mycobacteriales bacterium]